MRVPLGRRPAGWALIECLVLISVLTILLGLGAGTIRLLMKLDRAGRAARDQAADIERLADDFREDAHAASANPATIGDRMTLDLLGGRTAEYASRPTTIVRTIRQGDKVRRVESYRRPLKSTIRYEVAAGGPGPIAILRIDREPGAEASSIYRDYRIEAELGKHGRFSGRP